MTHAEWIAIVAIMMPVMGSVLVSTWLISAKLAGLKGKIINLEEKVQTLFTLWNERPWNDTPCEDHAVKLNGLGRRLERLEKK
jgi:hypothetical protein